MTGIGCSVTNWFHWSPSSRVNEPATPIKPVAACWVGLHPPVSSGARSVTMRSPLAHEITSGPATSVVGGAVALALPDD